MNDVQLPRTYIANVIEEARLSWVGGSDHDYDLYIADAVVEATRFRCPVDGCALANGPFHIHSEYDENEWATYVAEEREEQVLLGYDAEHDEEHGLDHLLVRASDLIRQDLRVEAGAVIEAAREQNARNIKKLKNGVGNE